MRSGVSSGKITIRVLSLTTPRDQSKLAKSLVANVERQRVFGDKMHAHLWIRSPGLGGNHEEGRLTDMRISWSCSGCTRARSRH